MTRRVQNRAGMTLIELLVVIAILALLMSLTIAAVMKLIGKGPEAQNKARITLIDKAVTNFTASTALGNVGYIPTGRIDLIPGSPTFGQVVGPFRLRPSYADTDFEAQYFKQVFGRYFNHTATGLPTADLDGNQTVTFFLTGGTVTNFEGFSTNPQARFTPKQSPSEERIGFLKVTPKEYTIAPNGQAWLVDRFGNPFAIFTGGSKGRGNYNGQSFTITNSKGQQTTVRPYIEGGKPVSPDGRQIISAGNDELFGPGGNWVGRSSIEAKDDQSNFSHLPLDSGPP